MSEETMNASRLQALLDELTNHGYETVQSGAGNAELVEAVVRSIEYGHLYVLTASEGWVQAMQMILEATQIESSAHRDQVVYLALRLHARFLGCRFGFDEDENLAVQYDIYPDMSAEHVAAALAQLCYVGSTTSALFEEALAGRPVDDARIDRAFEAD